MPLSNCIIPIQARLDEIQPYGYHQQPVGAINAMLSATNKTDQVKAKFLRNDGKAAKYQVTYVPADCTPPTDCSTVAGDRCAAGTSGEVTTAELTIGKCRFSGVIELTVAQFRDLCNFNPSQFTIAQIQRKMDTFRRTINADILADLCSYVGDFSDTVAGPKELALINPTTGAPNIIAEGELLSDFSDAGMLVNPIMIGGRSLNIYNRALKGGGVDAAGINIGASTVLNAYYDNQVQGICGTVGKESALAIAPQIIHMVNYLDNVGDFEANAKITPDNVLSFFTQGDTYHYGIIRDNVTGMYYDFDAIFDACTKTWKLSFSSKFDTWQLPLTQCFSSAFTGVLKYDLCPYNVSCPA